MLRDLLERYQDQWIGFRDSAAPSRLSKIVDIHDDYFTVQEYRDRAVHHVPWHSVLTILEAVEENGVFTEVGRRWVGISVPFGE